MVPQPAAPFTRRAWEETGDLAVNLRYQMDYEYYLRMARAGIRFGLLRQPIARFRYHSESKSVAEYDRAFWEAKVAIQKPYLPGWLRDWRRRDRALAGLNWLYRGRSFLVRGLLRGDLVPFKTTLSRKSVHQHA